MLKLGTSAEGWLSATAVCCSAINDRLIFGPGCARGILGRRAWRPGCRIFTASSAACAASFSQTAASRRRPRKFHRISATRTEHRLNRLVHYRTKRDEPLEGSVDQFRKKSATRASDERAEVAPHGYPSHGLPERKGARQLSWAAFGETKVMAVIIIECPKTNCEFSTGIIIDKASFDVLREVPARARCPHCGQEHEWSKRDTRLVETIPPGEWIEYREERTRVAR